MRVPFSIKGIYLIERRSFDQKYKFSNKNDTVSHGGLYRPPWVSSWRNLENIFSRPLFTIIPKPEMLKVTFIPF